MRFLSGKVEFNTRWEVKSTSTHSAASIEYLGVNPIGWVVLQLNARFENNSGKMIGAVQSVCIDMQNPDEDTETQPKGYKLTIAVPNKSVKVELEDVEDFLNRIRCCKCITSDDFQTINAKIKTLKRKLADTEALKQPLLLSIDNAPNPTKSGNCAY